jgi:hypothetical protein
MKTLLEHHYSLRIEELSTEDNECKKNLKACELLATDLGWRYLCDLELIIHKAMEDEE